MGIVKQIADYFRSANGGETTPVDRYGILQPLMATSEYVSASRQYFKLLSGNSNVTDLLSGRTKPTDPSQAKGVEAYKLYIHALAAHDQALERQTPLSTVLLTLDAVAGNLELIEDNFATLFGDMVAGSNESAIRSSSLIAIGYLETADVYTSWIGQLSAHLVPDDAETIPPFWSKGLMLNAKTAGTFASNNLNKWSPRYKGLLEEIKTMHRKGTDVAIKSGEQWMDEFVHDNQFSPTEQNLMTAAIRSPILMITSGLIARHQEKLELLASQKDWLIAKVALEEARLSGKTPDSPEYKRLRKAVDYYVVLVSKYEQKIERMRA